MSKLPASYRSIFFDSIDSTNKYALSAASAGESGNLWVVAAEQTDGRGRRGRPWSSQQGNLFATLLLIDPGPVSEVGQLPLVSALAVHQAVSDVLPPALRDAVRIKWPNDVLWGDQKICGILLESTMLASGAQAVVIGIGINCRTHPETTEGLAATDLSQSGYDVDPNVLFERLAVRLDEALVCWDQGRGLAKIREDWLANARGVGDKIVVRLPNEELHGTFDRLDEKGGLVLGLPDGTQQIIYAGDVFWPGAVR